MINSTFFEDSSFMNNKKDTIHSQSLKQTDIDSSPIKQLLCYLSSKLSWSQSLVIFMFHTPTAGQSQSLSIRMLSGDWCDHSDLIYQYCPWGLVSGHWTQRTHRHLGPHCLTFNRTQQIKLYTPTLLCVYNDFIYLQKNNFGSP